MNNILVLGAGRSSGALIDYLSKKSGEHSLQVTVADANEEQAKEKVKNKPNTKAIVFNIEGEDKAADIISKHDIVISMLPPAMHDKVAAHCLKLRKHLITASYISPAIKAMEDEVKSAGILFMGEMGLDPGIDHMSAMQLIHLLKEKGVEIISFKSSTGGLVAPESDDNPWHYKISWNPRNVVLAGQGAAQYLEDGKIKYIPYNRLFLQTTKIKLKSVGTFESYANRDSLSYRNIYGLENIPNLLRATLRYEGYCKSWNALVQLGLTDDTYKVHIDSSFTYHDWIASYLPSSTKPLERRVATFFDLKKSDKTIKDIKWLGLFDKKKIRLKEGTPAQITQDVIEGKWKMKSHDKDMVVMVHEFVYAMKKKRYRLESSLVVKGTDMAHTAMAKTVGLPLGMMAILLVTGKCELSGVHIPVMKEVYTPVLKELEEYGVIFDESVREIKK
jgi:saccharopine dehydrogenase-like NADP-dependent oxidoreductase